MHEPRKVDGFAEAPCFAGMLDEEAEGFDLCNPIVCPGENLQRPRGRIFTGITDLQPRRRQRQKAMI
jgi:hypothetical protein